MTGPVTDDAAQHFNGRVLNEVERLVMVPVIGAILLLGFYPQPAVKLVEPTAQAAMQRVQLVDPAPVVEGEQ